MENVMVAAHCRTSAGVFGAIFRPEKVKREERDMGFRAMDILKFVGLEDKSGVLAANLSYGDQRRLEIARAMCTDPVLLCLDEPAAGLNDTETEGLANLLRAIRKLGIPVLVVEHNMSLVMNVADRIVVLDSGAIIATGTPSEVQSNSRVIEAYLGRENNAA